MFKNLLSLYTYKYPKALVSLMYKSKYNSKTYLTNLNKTKDFTTTLKNPAPVTIKTILVMRLLALGMIIQITAGILFIVLGADHHIAGGVFFGAAIIILYPLTWGYLSVLVLILREWAAYGSGAA